MDEYFYLNQKFKKILYLKDEKRKKIILGTLTFLIFLFFSFSFGFSLFRPSQLTASFNEVSSINEANKESLKNESSPKIREEELTSLVKDKNNRTNILLIGVPGEPWPAPYLTDSIEIVSLSEIDKSALIVALPRDLLVKIPGSNYETRINSLFEMEQNPSLLQKKVAEITGLETQYWIIIDLQLIKNVINAVDGIDIEVKEDIYDPLFPTINRGYEVFSISAGPHHLDGETAIKYIRSRHEAKGDFSRIERQQQVMDALRIKALNPKYLPKLLILFNDFKGKTNIGLGEIKTLINFAQDFSQEETSKKIKYLILDAGSKDSLLVYGKTSLGKNIASVVWPRVGKFNYSEIQSRIINELNFNNQ
ncbi:MAG TPA: LCP family protein [Candidatus Pacearchaeota archaeon]|nr:LCP family protein [Candidatus Pacearchaeota archaeon]HOK94027.1 LCP family protein [Candidatus Pacearchaeota archaeon]HPO75098.1 LCP family protein [Candidatus Pacearchaeota archaeon]